MIISRFPSGNVALQHRSLISSKAINLRRIIRCRLSTNSSPLGMPHSVHSRDVTPSSDHDLSQCYWNNNISRRLWTRECPAYLQDLPQKSVLALSTIDQDFQARSWQEVKHIVESNQIDQFQRLPSQLRAYLKYMYELKKTHGSVMDFVQRNRLMWDSITPSGDVQFTNSADLKVLYNDWPYAIDPDIVHLVVWTKFPLEDDPATNDLTDIARDRIEQFVIRTFCGENGVPRDQLVWFKNWRSLKSIHALEHFHVMLYKPRQNFLESITNGDESTRINISE